MKRLPVTLVCALALFVLAAPIARASSDDGYFVRINNTTIEIRVTIGDPSYQALFAGIAAPENLFFTALRWAKTRESDLGNVKRYVTLNLNSGNSGSLKVDVAWGGEHQEDFLLTLDYPYSLARYEESFFTGVLDKAASIAVKAPLVSSLTLVIVRPTVGKSFPDSIYGYTDVFQGPLPGAYMLGPDKTEFFACFYYANIDRYLSDHLNGEFMIKKISIDRAAMAKLFQ
jgi:hypothetical protein